jgi:tetratricopeptide (TPR) repeat protein
VVAAGIALIFLASLGSYAQSLNPDTYDDTIARWLAQSVTREVSEAVRNHDYTTAEKLLIDSYQAQPRSPEILRFLGAVFFLDAKYLNCASALEKANSAGVLDERSRFTLAMAYVKLNRFDLARPELQILITAAPGQSLYPYWLGRLDFIDQRFQSSIAHLNHAISLDAHFSRAYDLRGLCYAALAEPEKAVSELNRAVEFNRALPHPSQWPPFDLGEELYKLGRIEQAQRYFRESISYDPGFAKAHFQMGLAEEKLGHHDEAIRELKSAIALDNRSPAFYYALARMLKRSGDFNAAHQATEQFESLSERNSEPR